MMDFKSQVQEDVKRTFLNLSEFAYQMDIEYYRNGHSKPPDRFSVPVVITDDSNMNSIWNKNKAQQRVGHDQTLYQKDATMWVALEDFQPPPKRGRDLMMNGKTYNVLGVESQDGALIIDLRILEE